MNLTTQQLATLQAELNSDPYHLGYAALLATASTVDLTTLLNFIRDGQTPCPVNGVIGPSGAVANATNATPIVVTTGVNHGLSSGNAVTVAGVGGNLAANSLIYLQGGVSFAGVFFVNVTAANKFQLFSDPAHSVNPVAGTGAYTSGGTWNWAIGALANGVKLFDQFVRVSDIIANIASGDAAAAVNATQQLILAALLNPNGSVQLTDALGNENNNAGWLTLLTNVGSASRKATKALESRNGSRSEQLLNLVNQAPAGQALNPNGLDVLAAINGHY